MNFLNFCGPIIKFLINKYAPNLASYPQYSELIKKYNATKILLPAESLIFIKILQELQVYLSQNNLTFRIETIKNYVGDSTNYSGLLNLILKEGHDIYICDYDPHSFKNIIEHFREIFQGDTSNLRVIAPLSLDDVLELYELFKQEFKVPIYPLSNGFITSKWLLNFTFTPHAPRTFYFPSNTSALDYIEKIRTIANKENLNYFILKDEYDYDLRDLIPYSVSPLEKLDYYCTFFYEKSKGISNVGGLVIEEFLSKHNLVLLYKSLIYDSIISDYWISSEIKLKPFSKGDFFHLIVDSSKEVNILTLSEYNSIFNPIISRYYRYLISSIDYVIYNDHPFVIDFNNIVSTLKYLQMHKIKHIDQYFKNFIIKILSEKNDESLVKQNIYLSTMNHFYKSIQNLGPSFIAGDRYISLDTLSERSVKEIVKEFLLIPEKSSIKS